MIKAGGGAIVNVGSVAGLRSARAGVAYTVSKFGLVCLAKSIAATYADSAIRCNVICPGSMDTGMADGVLATQRALALRTRDRGRPGPMEPDSVAEVTVFLTSDAARHISGAAIPVDREWTAY